MSNAEDAIRPLPLWVQTALQACVTSGGTLGAKSLASSLGNARSKRLLQIDSKCRETRLKAMKERRRLLEAENLITYVQDENRHDSVQTQLEAGNTIANSKNRGKRSSGSKFKTNSKIQEKFLQ